MKQSRKVEVLSENFFDFKPKKNKPSLWADCMECVNSEYWEELKEIIKDELNVKDVLIKKPSPGFVGASAQKHDLIVTLDTTFTSVLVDEGIMREVISAIQRQRKNQGLAITDKIAVFYKATPRVCCVIEEYYSEILFEVSALFLEKDFNDIPENLPLISKNPFPGEEFQFCISRVNENALPIGP